MSFYTCVDKRVQRECIIISCRGTLTHIDNGTGAFNLDVKKRTTSMSIEGEFSLFNWHFNLSLSTKRK